jgi:FkbM family methyltransferase
MRDTCAASLACDATFSQRGTNCSCAAVDGFGRRALSPGPNGDECASGGGCVALSALPGLRLVHLRAASYGGCFRMAVHQRRYGPNGTWLPRGDYVSDSLRLRGHWEFRSREHLEKHLNVSLPANGTLLDIGAHIGYFSLLFAQRGYRVVAIEPMPHNLRALRSSLCINPWLQARVTLLPFALTSASGPKHCVVRSGAHNRGNGVLHCRKGKLAHCNAAAGGAATAERDLCTQVEARTLDGVLAAANLPAEISLVKLDVESSECAVRHHTRTQSCNRAPMHPYNHVIIIQNMWMAQSVSACMVGECRLEV